MKVAPFPRMHVSLYVSDISKKINFIIFSSDRNPSKYVRAISHICPVSAIVMKKSLS